MKRDGWPWIQAKIESETDQCFFLTLLVIVDPQGMFYSCECQGYKQKPKCASAAVMLVNTSLTEANHVAQPKSVGKGREVHLPKKVKGSKEDLINNNQIHHS